jgi:hypothetical protein
MRQIIESYASENGMHITLSGIFNPRDTSDGPGSHRRFNTLSPAQRVAAARDALEHAGAKGLPPLANIRSDCHGRAIGLDAEAFKPVRRSRDSLFGHVCGPSGITEEPTKDSATRAARLHRALDRVLDERERRRKRRGADREPRHDHRDNQVSADSATAGMERAVLKTRDYGYAETDRASKLPRSTRVMDQVASGRPLGCDGRPMSDLQYYRNAAAACSGGRS